jgi:N-acetylmuramoyl-L-alanine amidase
MKTNPLVPGLAIVISMLAFHVANAAETATVSQNHVNVRGHPSLAGEVITQLQKGEKVTLLEEIPVESPKKGEPAKWARIQMPANTPVWVFAAFIDANSKSVGVSRVNLRAGPGENFSVVGRLERGEAIKEIRRVEDWIEIEAPDKAYAFVAMNFLSKAETTPTDTATKPEKTGAVPATPKTEPEQTSPWSCGRSNPKPCDAHAAAGNVTQSLKCEA